LRAPFAFALVDKYGSTVNSYYFVLCITSAHNQFYVLVVDTSENIIEAISHYRVSLRPDTWPGALSAVGDRSLLGPYQALSPENPSFCNRGRHGTRNSLHGLERSCRSFAFHHQLLTMDRRWPIAVRDKDRGTYIGQHCSLGIVVLFDVMI